jgi:methylisocitrate lyase
MFNAPRQMRKLLEMPEPIIRVAVSDPLMGRIAEKVGFKCLALGGFAVGARSCRPEPLADLTQLVTDAGEIQRAVNIPVIVDAGGCFGESIHAWDTVRRLEATGVAGLQMEDQFFPKRAHYHRDYREHTISVENMVDKITTAVAARSDPNFVIAARTDSMRTHGYDEGVKRAHAYLKAGADAISCFPNNMEETIRAPKDIGAPLSYAVSHGNRVDRPVPSVKELTEMGYKFISFATSGILAYYEGVLKTFSHLFENGVPPQKQDELIFLRKSLEDLVGLEELYRIEENTTEKARVVAS